MYSFNKQHVMQHNILRWASRGLGLHIKTYDCYWLYLFSKRITQIIPNIMCPSYIESLPDKDSIHSLSKPNFLFRFLFYINNFFFPTKHSLVLCLLRWSVISWKAVLFMSNYLVGFSSNTQTYWLHIITILLSSKNGGQV